MYTHGKCSMKVTQIAGNVISENSDFQNLLQQHPPDHLNIVHLHLFPTEPHWSLVTTLWQKQFLRKKKW